MKISHRSVLLVAIPFVLSLFGSAALAHTLDAAAVAKLNVYVKECNRPGMEPKPKMAELVTYLQANGFADAKLECGVSNQGATTPVILLHLPDGGEIFVNYAKSKSGLKVSDVIEDAKTPDGMKRYVLWPASKATAPKTKK